MASFGDLLAFAQKHTRILKARKNFLYTFGETRLPYLCISESGDEVVVREGEVTADKPKIITPSRDWEFSGFDFSDIELSGLGDGESPLIPVLLARGVKIPTAAYQNEAHGLRRISGSLQKTIEQEMERLAAANDIRTGVICAPDKLWSVAVLLYVGEQMARSAESNISEHFERLRLS